MIDFEIIKKLREKIEAERNVTGVMNVALFAKRVTRYLLQERIEKIIRLIHDSNDNSNHLNSIDDAFKGELTRKENFIFSFNEENNIIGIDLNSLYSTGDSFEDMKYELIKIILIGKFGKINSLFYNTSWKKQYRNIEFRINDLILIVNKIFDLLEFNFNNMLDSKNFNRVYAKSNNYFVEINLLDSEKFEEDIKNIKEEIDNKFKELKEKNKDSAEKISEINQDLQNIKAEFKHFVEALSKGNIEEAKKQNKWIDILKKTGSFLVKNVSIVSIGMTAQKLLEVL